MSEETKTFTVGKCAGIHYVYNKGTGIEFICDDTKKIIEWVKANAPEVKDFAEVRIKLDGIEKSFTLEDFKKRLGFDAVI